MLWIEIIAAALTLWSVYLATKGHLLSWPVGVWAVCLYAFVFFHEKLYADFCLQGFFAIQGVMGFLLWYYRGDVKKVHITKLGELTKKEKVVYISILLVIYLIVAFLFDKYTGAALPYVDSFVSVLSLFANYLLIKRKVENWYIWIFVDFIYIALFAYKGLIPSAILYTILLFLAIQGLKDWKNLKSVTHEK